MMEAISCNGRDNDPGESHERPPSPETLALFNSKLNNFLAILPSSSDIADGGWHTRRYDSVIPDRSHFVTVFGRVVFHEDFGVVRRTALHISRGTESNGPGLDDDFLLRIDSPEACSGDPLTIKVDEDSGRVIPDPHERIQFYDNFAIAARRQMLLDAPDFNERISDGITLPNLQITPEGDIYTDGLETVDHRQHGPLRITTSVRYPNEKEQINFERFTAAHEQACRDVGMELTEESAQMIISLLTRLRMQ